MLQASSSSSSSWKVSILKAVKIFSLWFELFVFQALRYPYFHVGQALGAPLQCSERHKTQANMPEAPLSLCKMDLESGEPSKTQAQLQTSNQCLHQPLQQIILPQDNMEPSTKQATYSTALTEGQQEPLSLVKRQPMSWQAVGITQVQLLNVRMGKPSCGLQSFNLF